MPKKFYFVPMGQSDENRPTGLYCTLTKQGGLRFNEQNCNRLFTGSQTFIFLYEDLAKRTLGFKFSDTLTNGIKVSQHGNVRVFKLSSIKTTNYGNLSIQKFLNRLNYKPESARDLYIKKYKDDLMGDLYYVEIPKNDE